MRYDTVQRLPTRMVDKPWGQTGIDPRFGAPGDRQIGEIWYEAPDGRSLDVMAKYLFTSERLSIQVHPDEAGAQARGLPHGKDECWIVLDVAPGAELGIGTRAPVSPEQLIAAARDGSIEGLIDWRPAHRGQFIYNPARTVHALGPGLTVLEIQQASDVTYRLYDYGRPRELHLEESLEAVDARPHRHPADSNIDEGTTRLLIDGPFFGLMWCAGSALPLPTRAHDVQLLPVDAEVRLQDGVAKPGECWLVEPGAELRSDGAFVLAWSNMPADERP